MSFFFDDMFFIFVLVFFCYALSFSWDGSMFLVDGVASFSLVYLSAVTFLIICFSEKSPSVRRLSEAVVIFSVIFFLSSTFFMIYVMIEASLVPILFLLLGYGRQVEKVSASYYFIFYSIFCSLPFLFALSAGFNIFGSIPFLPVSFIPSDLLFLLSLLFLAKIPLYGFHLWLPKVHVESPTSASILLSSILLKIGTYGFSRLLGAYSLSFSLWVQVLALAGILLGSFFCCCVSDIKLLVAWSSVVHMNFLLLIFLCSSSLSKSCALLLMISHGFISTSLFYIVGVCYGYFGTRILYLTHSLWAVSPVFSCFVLIFFLANASVPPFIGFFGEVLGVLSLFCSVPVLFPLILVYYLLVFYYSLIFVISMLVGKCSFRLPLLIVFPLSFSLFASVFSLLFLV